MTNRREEVVIICPDSLPSSQFDWFFVVVYGGKMVRQSQMNPLSVDFIRHLSSDQFTLVNSCFFWGIKRPTQLYRDYFISHEIRIPINQPGFNGMSTGFGSCCSFENGFGFLPIQRTDPCDDLYIYRIYRLIDPTKIYQM